MSGNGLHVLHINQGANPGFRREMGFLTGVASGFNATEISGEQATWTSWIPWIHLYLFFFLNLVYSHLYFALIWERAAAPESHGSSHTSQHIEAN